MNEILHIIEELKSYNNRLSTPERLEDIEILASQLSEEYTVKTWFFNKHLRVAVLKDGVLL